MLTLTYLTSKSNLLPSSFKWEFLLKKWIVEQLKPNSLFSLDMFNIMRQWMSIDKYQRLSFAFENLFCSVTTRPGELKLHMACLLD